MLSSPNDQVSPFGSTAYYYPLIDLGEMSKGIVPTSGAAMWSQWQLGSDLSTGPDAVPPSLCVMVFS